MKYLSLILFAVFVLCCQNKSTKSRIATNKPEAMYVQNRLPLKLNPYSALPLGAIKPKGWLREMLLTQKNGATGHLDELYPLMDKRNGWLGGDGDQWI